MKSKLSFLANESLWIKAICSSFLIVIVISFLPFFASCDEISNSVLRLHVLANSNSDEDQELKLKVRDAVLIESEKWYNGAENFEEANTAVCTNLQSIQGAAERVIKESGYDYIVTAKVTEKYFTTRDYEDFSLPAGKYRTLQIEIGEAKGKNWWCMVYPALCVPASSKTDEEILAEIPNDEREIITKPKEYKIKFKVVEWLEGFKSKLD